MNDSMLNFIKLKKKKYDEADEGDKARLDMLLPSIIMSASIAGFAVGFAVFFLSKSKVIGTLVAVILGYILFRNHKSFFFKVKGGVITFFLIFSVGMSGLVSLPMKFSNNKEFYYREYKADNEAKYFAASVEGRESKKVLDQRKQRLEDNLQKASDNFANDKQGLYDARRLLDAFNKSYEMEVQNVMEKALEDAIAKNGYQQKLDESESAVFSYFLSRTFNGEGDPGEKGSFWLTFVVFFILEASPSLIALSLMGSSYMKSLKHDNEMKAIVMAKRNESEIQMVQDYDNLPTKLARRAIADALLVSINNDFRDTTEILRQYQVLHNLEGGQNNGLLTNEVIDLIEKPSQNGRVAPIDNNDIPLFDYNNDDK